jgi:hypothetical protein
MKPSTRYQSDKDEGKESDKRWADQAKVKSKLWNWTPGCMAGRD